jgi:phosphopantothenoylcysteine decarboxylase/phosphopantothenate--cysteine ligase
VVDHGVKTPKTQKIKKHLLGTSLQLVQNPDILSAVGHLKEKRPFVVGFASETENLQGYAEEKRVAKQADLIVANEVGKEGQGFCSGDNAVTVLGANFEKQFSLQSKPQLAHKLIGLIANYYKEHYAN